MKVARSAEHSFPECPTLQGFDPSAAEHAPLWTAIAELGVPAVVHTGQNGIGARLRGGDGLILGRGGLRGRGMAGRGVAVISSDGSPGALNVVVCHGRRPRTFAAASRRAPLLVVTTVGTSESRARPASSRLSA